MAGQRNVMARNVIAAVIVVAGLGLAVSPFASMWRLGSDVTAFLPDQRAMQELSNDARVIDDRSTALSALFDPDFILAIRSYRGVRADHVLQALSQEGFEPGYTDPAGESWLWRDCCGSYDAALARVTTEPSGEVRVDLSVHDSDVQLVWWLPVVGGLALVGLGLLLFWFGRQSSAGKRQMPPAAADGIRSVLADENLR